MIGRLLERLRQPPGQDEDPDRAVALAAATLLIEIAWADHHISETELDAIRRMLVERHGIDSADIQSIVEESKRRQQESVGLYQFTRVINEYWDEPSRFELIVSLWRLAFEDRYLDALEEHTIRKISDLLYVSHARFIEAKRTAREESTR